MGQGLGAGVDVGGPKRSLNKCDSAVLLPTGTYHGDSDLQLERTLLAPMSLEEVGLGFQA